MWLEGDSGFEPRSHSLCQVSSRGVCLPISNWVTLPWLLFCSEFFIRRWGSPLGCAPQHEQVALDQKASTDIPGCSGHACLSSTKRHTLGAQTAQAYLSQLWTPPVQGQGASVVGLLGYFSSDLGDGCLFPVCLLL